MSAAIVSGCDAPPVLELCEEVLDLVALTVEHPVVFEGDLAAPARRDAGLDALGEKRLAECPDVLKSVRGFSLAVTMT